MNGKRNLTKRGLKAIGIVLTAGGLACTVAGSVDLFLTLGTGEFPVLFWLLAAGLPMMSIGVCMLMFGFRRETPPWTCPACGEENAPEMRFCSQCGAPRPRVCPRCGAALKNDARYCGMCGEKLRGTEENDPPHASTNA